MKRVLISVIIIVSIVFSSIIMYRTINNELTVLTEKLDLCMEFTENNSFSRAKTKAEEITQSWKKVSSKLKLIVSEDVCDEVNNELEAIITNIDERDIIKAKQSIKNSKIMIKEIVENEKISLSAIL